MKIKVFTDIDELYLEKVVNEFMANHNVLDIRFSTTSIKNGDGNEVVEYSVVLTYKEKEN